MKKLLIALCLFVLPLSLAACTSADTSASDLEKTANQNPDSSDKPTEAISGSITMSGSTSMEKFANAINEAFMEKYPDVMAQAEFTGSGAGIEAVGNGKVDIGNASRALKEEEKAKGITENIVAIDGIGVIVDKENYLSDITKDTLSSIYTGKITNWNQIGGADQPIIVIGREAGSGTRGAFEELLEIQEQCVYGQEIDSTGAVMAKVASTPGAIGYISIDIIDDTVKALHIDGIAPTAENIKLGSYSLSRPFVMATKGEISKQNDVVKAFFDFIDSDEGQAIIEQVGLVSTK